MLSYDGAVFKVYIDGLLAGQTTTPLTIDTTLLDGLWVGSHSGDYTGIAVYPTVLTDQQITNHHTLGQP